MIGIGELMVTARTWLQKTVYDVDTENFHHPTQNSPKKYMCRTSPV